MKKNFSRILSMVCTVAMLCSVMASPAKAAVESASGKLSDDFEYASTADALAAGWVNTNNSETLSSAEISQVSDSDVHSKSLMVTKNSDNSATRHIISDIPTTGKYIVKYSACMEKELVTRVNYGDNKSYVLNFSPSGNKLYGPDGNYAEALWAPNTWLNIELLFDLDAGKEYVTVVNSSTNQAILSGKEYDIESNIQITGIEFVTWNTAKSYVDDVYVAPYSNGASVVLNEDFEYVNTVSANAAGWVNTNNALTLSSAAISQVTESDTHGKSLLVTKNPDNSATRRVVSDIPTTGKYIVKYSAYVEKELVTRVNYGDNKSYVLNFSPSGNKLYGPDGNYAEALWAPNTWLNIELLFDLDAGKEYVTVVNTATNEPILSRKEYAIESNIQITGIEFVTWNTAKSYVDDIYAAPYTVTEGELKDSFEYDDTSAALIAGWVNTNNSSTLGTAEIAKVSDSDAHGKSLMITKNSDNSGTRRVINDISTTGRYMVKYSAYIEKELVARVNYGDNKSYVLNFAPSGNRLYGPDGNYAEALWAPNTWLDTELLFDLDAGKVYVTVINGSTKSAILSEKEYDIESNSQITGIEFITWNTAKSYVDDVTAAPFTDTLGEFADDFEYEDELAALNAGWVNSNSKTTLGTAEITKVSDSDAHGKSLMITKNSDNSGTRHTLTGMPTTGKQLVKFSVHAEKELVARVYYENGNYALNFSGSGNKLYGPDGNYAEALWTPNTWLDAEMLFDLDAGKVYVTVVNPETNQAILSAKEYSIANNIKLNAVEFITWNTAKSYVDDLSIGEYVPVSEDFSDDFEYASTADALAAGWVNTSSSATLGTTEIAKVSEDDVHGKSLKITKNSDNSGTRHAISGAKSTGKYSYKFSAYMEKELVARVNYESGNYALNFSGSGNKLYGPDGKYAETLWPSNVWVDVEMVFDLDAGKVYITAVNSDTKQTLLSSKEYDITKNIKISSIEFITWNTAVSFVDNVSFAPYIPSTDLLEEHFEYETAEDAVAAGWVNSADGTSLGTSEIAKVSETDPHGKSLKITKNPDSSSTKTTVSGMETTGKYKINMSVFIENELVVRVVHGTGNYTLNFSNNGGLYITDATGQINTGLSYLRNEWNDIELIFDLNNGIWNVKITNDNGEFINRKYSVAKNIKISALEFVTWQTGNSYIDDVVIDRYFDIPAPTVKMTDIAGEDVDYSKSITPGIAKIEIDFAEAMLPETVVGAVTIDGTVVNGTFNSINQVYTVNRTESFSEGVHNIAVANTVKNINGSGMDYAYQLEFTVGKAECKITLSGLYNGENSKIELLNGITAGSSITVKANYTNPGASKDAVFAVAYYNNDKLVSFDVLDLNDCMPEFTSGEISKSTAVTDKAFDEVAVYCWDTVSGMTSYCEPLYFTGE